MHYDEHSLSNPGKSRSRYPSEELCPSIARRQPLGLFYATHQKTSPHQLSSTLQLDCYYNRGEAKSGFVSVRSTMAAVLICMAFNISVERIITLKRGM